MPILNFTSVCSYSSYIYPREHDERSFTLHHQHCTVSTLTIFLTWPAMHLGYFTSFCSYSFYIYPREHDERSSSLPSGLCNIRLTGSAYIGAVCASHARLLKLVLSSTNRDNSAIRLKRLLQTLFSVLASMTSDLLLFQANIGTESHSIFSSRAWRAILLHSSTTIVLQAFFQFS